MIFLKFCKKNGKPVATRLLPRYSYTTCKNSNSERHMRKPIETIASGTTAALLRQPVLRWSVPLFLAGILLQLMPYFGWNFSTLPGSLDTLFNRYVLEHGYLWLLGEEPSFWDNLFNNEYFWLYISSFVIAVVIIITVIAVVIGRWKKKHPKEVVVENVAKTEKDIKVVPTAPQVKEDALEADEYVDEIKPTYVQRVNKNKSRKDRKKGKK